MLETFLVSQLFSFLLVFCRLGSALTLLPGFGEVYVPVRVRLFMALMFSLVLSPVIKGLPPMPGDLVTLVSLITAEILIGIFLGGLSRIVISTLHMAGMIIAYQAGLASALTQDVAAAQGQGTSMGNLLGLTALILIFSTGLHHVMLRGLADSYSLFLPGHFPNLADFAGHATQSLNAAFRMSMQLSAPSIVLGLMVYLTAGIIGKLMPNIQIFFILTAPQLLLSFFILMVSFSAIMLWFMEYFKTTLAGFLTPPL